MLVEGGMQDLELDEIEGNIKSQTKFIRKYPITYDFDLEDIWSKTQLPKATLWPKETFD